MKCENLKLITQFNALKYLDKNRKIFKIRNIKNYYIENVLIGKLLKRNKG